MSRKRHGCILLLLLTRGPKDVITQGKKLVIRKEREKNYYLQT